MTDWKTLVKEAEEKARVADLQRKDYVRLKKKELAFRKIFRRAIALISVQLILGFGAGYLMYILFGWEELAKSVLSWVIGLTLVATMITAFLNRYHKASE